MHLPSGNVIASWPSHRLGERCVGTGYPATTGNLWLSDMLPGNRLEDVPVGPGSDLFTAPVRFCLQN